MTEPRGTWTITLEGGPAFCVNAAHACSSAASNSGPGPRQEASLRLASALVNATYVAPELQSEDES